MLSKRQKPWQLNKGAMHSNTYIIYMGLRAPSYFWFWVRVSCSPSYPWTPYVAKMDPPASTSQVQWCDRRARPHPVLCGTGAWTHGLVNAMQALYSPSYIPIFLRPILIVTSSQNNDIHMHSNDILTVRKTKPDYFVGWTWEVSEVVFIWVEADFCLGWIACIALFFYPQRPSFLRAFLLCCGPCPCIWTEQHFTDIFYI